MVREPLALVRIDSSKPFEPIVRKRLTDRFARASAYPLTVVAAPAGFGKSVAIDQFLRSTGIANVRFSVRREHASLRDFARGLIQVAKGLETSRAFAAAWKSAEKCPSPALELANWASERLRDLPETIVIDNLEFAGSEAMRFLTGLIDRSASEARWILASRNPYELPLATWLAYARMDMPIDEVDLRFSNAEADEIAAAHVPGISATDVRGLWKLTDGWATAFVLGLRLLARGRNLERVAGPTREIVFSYLAEQVLLDLDTGDRKFLLDTAFFSSLDAESLADLGYPDWRSRLSRLQKLTGFIGSDSHGSFKHHALFQEFLQDELKKSGKNEVERSMRVAAESLERRGSVVEALDLYGMLHDSDAVGRILIARGSALVARGARSVETALGSLPADMRSTVPVLIALNADLKAHAGQLSDAVALYNGSLEGLADPDAQAAVASRMLATLCLRPEGREASETPSRFAALAVRDPATKAAFLAAQARFLAAGDGADARTIQMMRQALDLASLCDDENLLATVLQKAAEVHLLAGLREDAEKYAAAALQIAEPKNFASLTARSYLVLAGVARSSDQTRAQWAAAQAKQSADACEDRIAWLDAYAYLYAIAVERRDLPQIADLDVDLSVALRLEYRPATLTSALATRLTWSRDFHGAHETLTRSSDTFSGPSARALRHAEIALYAAAASEREAAEEAIGSGSGHPLGSGWPADSQLVLSRIWSALAGLIIGRAAVANNILRELEREGRGLSAPLRSLCDLARSVYVHAETGAGHAEIVERLKAVREAGYEGYGRLVEHLPLPAATSTFGFGSLTRMEVRVLRLLASGGTSKSVGGELERSPQTIDSHIKAVIRKLGCKGRQEAVRLAREHGII